MTENDNAVPRSFWIISIAALVWNLLGLFIFYTQVTMTESVLMAMTEAQQLVYENMPTWATAVHATAVTMGTLGCVLLLLRRGLAVACFGLSLAALVVQMYYAFVYVDSVEIFGGGSAIVSTTVFVIAVLLLWYARNAKENNRLN